MRRREVRLRKSARGLRYRRAMSQARREPMLLFVERAAVRDPIVPEMGRVGGAPRLGGFWRGPAFFRVARIVETRREHEADYFRVITDQGSFDVRRSRRLDPVGLRPLVQWELIAELDAVEVRRPF